VAKRALESFHDTATLTIVLQDRSKIRKSERIPKETGNREGNQKKTRNRPRHSPRGRDLRLKLRTSARWHPIVGKTKSFGLKCGGQQTDRNQAVLRSGKAGRDLQGLGRPGGQAPGIKELKGQTPDLGGFGGDTTS